MTGFSGNCATASESSPTKCLRVCNAEEHCLTEDGQAVAQNRETNSVRRSDVTSVFVPEGLQPLAGGRAQRYHRFKYDFGHCILEGCQNLYSDVSDVVEMRPANHRFLESLRDSKPFWFAYPVASLALSHRLIAAVPPGQRQISNRTFHRKSLPVLSATASESSPTQCLRLRIAEEHCLTEDGQAVAQD